MNYPVGIVGSSALAKNHVQEMLLQDDDIMELDSKAGIDEIKQLRVFLMNRGMNRRVGVVYGLNKWKENHQAVLLKIFEQLPSFNAVYYTASFMPSMVIQTRSLITQVGNVSNELIKKLCLQILDGMKGDAHEHISSMMHGLQIVAQVQSWVDDGVIGSKEQSVILRSLGLQGVSDQ